jgi:membrane-bound serine protease (ClpP class)
MGTIRSITKVILFINVIFIASFFFGFEIINAQTNERKVLLVSIDETITPATFDLINLAIDEAHSQKFDAVLISINTFGGLSDSTFSITDKMLGSDIPIIVYVYPEGAQAWSAGTYILMASNYAAMAPFTIIGSAQPIQGLAPIEDTKIINAFVEKMKTFARIHGRNETLAEQFITDNKNVNPEKALEYGVIDRIASSPRELLQKIDGSVVKTLNGEKILNTKDALLIEFTAGPRTLVLRIITDPLISSLLMTIGILAIVLGLSSPGFGVELAGGIMLILGLIGAGFDVNYAALALLFIGVGLILIEVYSGTGGAAAIGGIIVMAIGSVLLVTSPPEPLIISPELYGVFVITVLGVMVVIGAFFAFLVFKVLAIRRKKPVLKNVPKEFGKAVDLIKPGQLGYVMIEGELWLSLSDEKIEPGTKVRVIGKDGVNLVVKSETEKEKKT